MRDVEHVHRHLDPAAAPTTGVAHGHDHGAVYHKGLLRLDAKVHPSVTPVIHHSQEAVVAAVDPGVGKPDGYGRHHVLVDEREQGRIVAGVVGGDRAVCNLEGLGGHALKYHPPG